MTFTVTVLGLKDSGDVSVFERLGDCHDMNPSVIGRRAVDYDITIDNVKHNVKYLHFNDMSRGKEERDKSDFLIFCITQEWLESLALTSQEDLVLKFNEITPLLPKPSESPSVKELLIVVTTHDEKKLKVMSESAETGLSNLRVRLKEKRDDLSLLDDVIHVTETSYKGIRKIKEIILEKVKLKTATDETKTRKSYFSYKVASAGFALTSLGCTSFALFGTATPIATFLGASTFTILTLAGAGLTGVLAVVFFVAAAYLLHKQSANEEPGDGESARLLPEVG